MHVRYVYLLQSVGFAGTRYVGVTSNLRRRLAEHNSGASPHTSKFMPWRLVTYVAFSDLDKAEAFESYLKPAPATPSRTSAWGSRAASGQASKSACGSQRDGEIRRSNPPPT
jgi:putative endonuclease